ncbi:hypothetical protein QQ045_002327 [Rhodiola kirilowii]
MAIVTMLLTGVTLRKYLFSMRPGCLDTHVALGFAVDIARGMECLHSHGIIHCDLKPGNPFTFAATFLHAIPSRLTKPAVNSTLEPRSPGTSSLMATTPQVQRNPEGEDEKKKLRDVVEKMERLRDVVEKNRRGDAGGYWDFGQTPWDSYEIVKMCKRLEDIMVLEDSSERPYGTKECVVSRSREGINSLRYLFDQMSSRRFSEPKWT